MTLVTRGANLGDILGVVINLPPEERTQIEAFTGRAFDIDAVALEAAGYRGPKWAVVEEADPFKALVVGGFISRRPGVYESWFLAKPEVWKPGSGITQVTADIIKGMLDNGAHRLETICLASRLQTRRWYERVGLTFETILHNYGAHGEDAAVYVALRKRAAVN